MPKRTLGSVWHSFSLSFSITSSKLIGGAAFRWSRRCMNVDMWYLTTGVFSTQIVHGTHISYSFFLFFFFFSPYLLLTVARKRARCSVAVEDGVTWRSGASSTAFQDWAGNGGPEEATRAMGLQRPDSMIRASKGNPIHHDERHRRRDPTARRRRWSHRSRSTPTSASIRAS